MLSAKSIIVCLEPFVRLVERNDELLRGCLLDPSPPFSIRQTKLSEVEDALAEALHRALGSNQPEVVLIWGRCRVGTTAIANVFGRAGLKTHYQPIKTWLRHYLLDLDFPPLSLSMEKRVVIKETSGPFSLAGCLMDPLRVLLMAGVDPSRISMVIVERSPLASWESWLSKWREQLHETELLRNFILSAMNRKRVEDTARRVGVRYLVFRIERATPQLADASMRGLFSELGLVGLYNADRQVECVEDAKQEGVNRALTFMPLPEPFPSHYGQSRFGPLGYCKSPQFLTKDWQEDVIEYFGLASL